MLKQLKEKYLIKLYSLSKSEKQVTKDNINIGGKVYAYFRNSTFDFLYLFMAEENLE